MRYSLLLLLIFSYLFVSAQDTSRLQISLLTCSPGEDLYATFGHSALRVIDSVSHTDVVYNYGTFNFEEPGFYTKFIRGKLLYSLSAADFSSFKDSYEYEQRSMTEQVLNLSGSGKIKMVDLLRTNLKPQNKYYKYDFLFDNCTTRLRDLLEKSADSSLHYTPVLKQKMTFRELIHVYLDQGKEPWSKFGIDLLLGSKTDAVMKVREVMFLPDFLMYSFDNGTIGVKPIVAINHSVYEVVKKTKTTRLLPGPLFIFSLLLILIILLSFFKNAIINRILILFDIFFFFVIGLAGIIILFMWIGTEHVMCSNNYNIIWALPSHAVAAFFLNSKRKWLTTYFLTTAAIDLLLLLSWCILPQGLNISFLPLILLLIYRSLAFYKFKKNHARPIR